MEKLTNPLQASHNAVKVGEIVRNSQISSKVILLRSTANLLQLKTKISTSLFTF